MRLTFPLLVLVNLLTAQTYSIGDTVDDFSKSIIFLELKRRSKEVGFRNPIFILLS